VHRGRAHANGKGSRRRSKNRAHPRRSASGVARKSGAALPRSPPASCPARVVASSGMSRTNAVHGDPVRPSCRRERGSHSALVPREPARGHRHPGRRLGEAVEPADENRPEEAGPGRGRSLGGCGAEGKAAVLRITIRPMSSGCRVPSRSRSPRPSRGPPGGSASKPEARRPVPRCRRSGFQPVVVAPASREAHPHVVGRDAADRRRQLPDQVAVVEGPGRISVEHEDGLVRAGTLVQVAHPRPPGVVNDRGERIEPREPRREGGRFGLRHHSRASIRQLSPLPMPIRATLFRPGRPRPRPRPRASRGARPSPCCPGSRRSRSPSRGRGRGLEEAPAVGAADLVADGAVDAGGGPARGGLPNSSQVSLGQGDPGLEQPLGVGLHREAPSSAVLPWQSSLCSVAGGRPAQHPVRPGPSPGRCGRHGRDGAAADRQVRKVGLDLVAVERAGEERPDGLLDQRPAVLARDDQGADGSGRSRSSRPR
jgi:hypothetical protein